jgi:tRNA-specific 2-thiouridylase
MMSARVVVAMSGGVDSSVAAWLLREEGYEVVGLFMRMGVFAETETAPRRSCCSLADAADARRVADLLGIPFYVLDFQAEFDRIIKYFCDEYCRGRTPNPCIVCNRDLKFGRLFEKARQIGADLIATGHYARIEKAPAGPVLKRGLDPAKDQSYVLFAMAPEQLAHTLLPLGAKRKADVRAMARDLRLPVQEKPDSQEICFVPDDDYMRLLRERRPDALRPGVIVDTAGRVLARHEGVARFTIGQRHGLGIAVGEPRYVVDINPETAVVTVGPREALLRKEMDVADVNWLVPGPVPESLGASVQIRYTHRAAPATVRAVGSRRVHVIFDEPQSAITPGQAAVFYDGDVVLGGGWIGK